MPVWAAATSGWWGSLLQGQADASGLRYQRHRFYDPSTGLFTQEDPIGLAGGRNLYAFAGGDPINFRDPFGLCPEDKGGDGKHNTIADCPPGSSGHTEFNQRAGGRLEAAGWADPMLFFGGAQSQGTASVIGRAFVPQTKSVLGHIFRTSQGHVRPATEASRQRFVRLFEQVANNPSNAANHLLSDAARSRGTQMFTQHFTRGTVWVHVNNGRIFNAGVNPFR